MKFLKLGDQILVPNKIIWEGEEDEKNYYEVNFYYLGWVALCL